MVSRHLSGTMTTDDDLERACDSFRNNYKRIVGNDERPYEIAFEFRRLDGKGKWTFYDKNDMTEAMCEMRKGVRAGKIYIRHYNSKCALTPLGDVRYYLVVQSDILGACPDCLHCKKYGPSRLAYFCFGEVVEGWVWVFKSRENRDMVAQYVMKNSDQEEVESYLIQYKANLIRLNEDAAEALGQRRVLVKKFQAEQERRRPHNTVCSACSDSEPGYRCSHNGRFYYFCDRDCQCVWYKQQREHERQFGVDID